MDELERLRQLAGMKPSSKSNLAESAPTGMEDLALNLKKQYPATARSTYNKNAECRVDEATTSVEISNPNYTGDGGEEFINVDVEFHVEGTYNGSGPDEEPNYPAVIIDSVVNTVTGEELLGKLSPDSIAKIENACWNDVELNDRENIDNPSSFYESSDEEAEEWARNLFRGYAAPHQTRVKRPAFTKIPGRKPKPEADPIAEPGEDLDTLLARRDEMDVLLPLAKERDHLIHRAERWGPLPPSVKLDIDDSHYRTRDVAGRIEKTKASIALLKNYIATKRSLYSKKRVMEDGDSYTGDSDLDTAIDTMLRNASDAFMDKDDALVKVTYFLIDQGIDNQEVYKIMQRVEQSLGDNAISESEIDEGDIAILDYSTARKLSQKLDAEKWRRLQQDSQRDSEAADEERKLFWKDVLRNRSQEQQVTSECGLSNGYGDEEFIDGNDYFPSGATSSVTKSVGPSGARHGDNPEQKLAQIAETYEQLISAYKQHIQG